MIFKAFCLFFMLLPFAAGAESLWDSQSQSLITGVTRLKVGDLLQVRLEMEGALSFSSVKSNEKSFSLTIEKAASGNPLDFLPQPLGQHDSTYKGKNEMSLKDFLVIQVLEVTPQGYLVVQGSKQVSMGGQIERILLQGLVDPRRVSGASLNLDSIANLRLEITSLADGTSAQKVLTTPDLLQDGQLKLTEEKQREMLVSLYNRFLGTIFLENP